MESLWRTDPGIATNSFHGYSQLIPGLLDLAVSLASGSVSVMSERVVITGGQGALGRALATEFSMAGYDVAAPGREGLDVTDPASREKFFSTPEIGLLICAAGISRDGLLLHQDPVERDAVIAANFAAARDCARLVLPAMRAQRRGHLVFVSSFSALHPPAGQTAYAAAKAALIGYAQGLAAEMGTDNIRVNVLLPGFMETPMTAAVSPARRAEVLARHALHRFNTHEAVAAFVRFLHESLPHTSGQVFNLDSRVS